MTRTWPVDYALTDPSVFDDPSLQAFCEDMAVELLWNWTGRVYGHVEAVTRPDALPPPLAGPGTWEGLGPYARQRPGYGVRVPLGLRGDVVAPRHDPTVVVLDGPVAEVDEVLIGALVLSPSAYEVRRGSRLARIDGQPWPQTQDLTLPAGSPGTWQVTYQRGTSVPQGGQAAAGTLAVQLGKAATNAGDCALPQRVQSVSRQGVTVGIMLDTFEDLQEGRTGIWSIDSWIASVTTARRVGGVRSVDVPWTR